MANSTSGVARTATESLKLFWERGFFRNWRKKAAIEQHLSKSGYNFSSPELGMALKRAGHLTRRGKHGSYEYIQKYPFIAEKIISAKKKGK